MRCRLLIVAFPVLIFSTLIACYQAFAASEQVLWSFGGGDGKNPNGSLIMDASGDLYGTTELGGDGQGGTGPSVGTVFKLTPTGEESVLWNFGPEFDGSLPLAGVVLDKNGNLFGTTSTGGQYDNDLSDFGGTAFKLTPDGQQSVLWSFGNGTDGLAPLTGLIIDTSGNLFGTTGAGGVYNTNFGGTGTAFELTPARQESVLWSFGNGTDGIGPSSSLIMDATGNLYGTTGNGGIYGSGFPKTSNGGTLFKLKPPVSAPGAGVASTAPWTESILWNFGNGADGQNPNSLIMDANDNFFGTTAAGGANGAGTVFEVTSAGQESVLWSFGSGTDGQVPNGLIMDTNGNLFGTTGFGGIYNSPFECNNSINSGCGTAFKLTPPSSQGGSWTQTILWNFGNASDGALPTTGLIMDTNGNLLGTTSVGGALGAGTIFELSNLNTASGQIVLKSPGIAFPNTAVGQTSSFKLAIRNTGTGTLTGTVNPPPAPFALNGSGSFTLAPHTGTTITLTFTPTLATRFHRTDTVASNSKNNSAVNLNLRGIGTP